MATVKVEKNNYTVEPLYQWDLNQQLEIYGLSLASVPEIHFTNAAMSRAIVRQANMDAAGVVRVDVPNSLLQKPYTIQVYVCTYAGSTFETQYKLEIPVKARTQPADYELVDDPEVYSFNALENQVVNALVAIEQSKSDYRAAVAAEAEAKATYERGAAEIDAKVKEAAGNLTGKDVGVYEKEEILSPETKTTYGLEANATPDEAFKKLAFFKSFYCFRVTVALADGTPVPYVVLNGLLGEDRVTVAQTDEAGVCEFAICETPSVNVSISDYIGIVNKTETLTASNDVFVTPVTIVVEEDNSLKLIQTSGTYRVLPNREVDMCAVGGGASGAANPLNGQGGGGVGGGGGFVNQVFDATFTSDNNTVELSVGAGGDIDANQADWDNTPHAGGDTTVQYLSTSLVAKGATGQLGNGDGGAGAAFSSVNASPGTRGQVRVFNDETLPLPGGGGGGSGAKAPTTAAGGADFGGNGANVTVSGAGNGRGPGGGGGGGTAMSGGLNAGRGGDGGLYIRVKAVSA